MPRHRSGNSRPSLARPTAAAVPLVLAAALAGCGGGGGKGTPAVDTTVSRQVYLGAWATADGTSLLHLLPDGSIRGLRTDTLQQTAGHYAYAQGRLSGTLTRFGSAQAPLDAHHPEIRAVDGTFTASLAIPDLTVHATFPSGSGEAVLERDSPANVQTSLHQLAGTYAAAAGACSGHVPATAVVGEDGRLTLAAGGHTLSGQLTQASPDNPAGNGYRVSGRLGGHAYSGLAYLRWGYPAPKRDVLVLMLHAGPGVGQFSGLFTRQ